MLTTPQIVSATLLEDDKFSARDYFFVPRTRLEAIAHRWEDGTASKLDLAVEAAKLIFDDPEWVEWADKWLSGEDRSVKQALDQATRFRTLPNQGVEAAYYAALACVHQMHYDTNARRYAAYAIRCAAVQLGLNPTELCCDAPSKAASIMESKEPSLQELKKHRQPLSPEERKQLGAVGVSVWKAKVGGKTIYVCNTHRAYRTAPTFKDILKEIDYVESTG